MPRLRGRGRVEITRELGVELMRQTVVLSSKLLVESLATDSLYIRIQKENGRIDSMKIKENEENPFPYDMTHLRFSISRERRPAISNVLITEKFTGDAIGPNYLLGDGVSVNLQMIEEENNKKLMIVPPLVIKNMLLAPLSLRFQRINDMRTTINPIVEIEHMVSSREEDYEIYAPIDGNLTITCGIDQLRSEELQLPLQSFDQRKEWDCWLLKNEQRAFKLNVFTYKHMGSYVLEIFVKAMLIDELFLPLQYSQNVRTREQVIYPVNQDWKQDEEERNVSILQGANIGILGNRPNHPDPDRSKIYHLEQDEKLFVSDKKYNYESMTVETRNVGEQELRMFVFNSRRNAPEFYDVVASNSVSKQSKIFFI